MNLDHPLFTTFCCINFYFDYFKDAALNGDYDEAIENLDQVIAYVDDIQQRVSPAPLPKEPKINFEDEYNSSFYPWQASGSNTNIHLFTNQSLEVTWRIDPENGTSTDKVISEPLITWP